MQSALPNTLSLTHRPLPLANSLFGKIVLTIAATEFVALCAGLVSMPLPFTLVPLTLQTFAVIPDRLLRCSSVPLTVGFSASMVLYLAEGATGLPVFSPHGLGGVAQLAGPTGGYLASYPFCGGMRRPLHRKIRLFNSRNFPKRHRRSRHHRQRAHLRARSALARPLSRTWDLPLRYRCPSYPSYLERS